LKIINENFYSIPYKENYSKDYAGAVSIFVNGVNKYSKFKNKIKVYGNTNYSNLLSKII
jgi:hypothetical protein